MAIRRFEWLAGPDQQGPSLAEHTGAVDVGVWTIPVSYIRATIQAPVGSLGITRVEGQDDVAPGE
jgi:hypothetical protein